MNNNFLTRYMGSRRSCIKTFCNTEYVSICCFKKSSAHEMFQKYNDWSSLWRHVSTVLHFLMFNIFKCTYFCNHYRKGTCHIYKYSSEKHFEWILFYQQHCLKKYIWSVLFELFSFLVLVFSTTYTSHLIRIYYAILSMLQTYWDP